MIYLYAGAAALIALTAFGAGWKTNGWMHDSARLAEERARAEQVQKIAQAYDRNATELEAKLQRLRPIYRTINNEVQREIRQETVYRDCVLPAGGVSVLDRAVDAANNTGKPADPVPAAPKGGTKP